MFKYVIKNMEPFKDGTIAELEGRFVKAGEILTVSEITLHRMQQSGAVLEILETLVPNPHWVNKPPVDSEQAHEIKPEETPALKEVGESPLKRKAGRPKKAAK